MSLKNSEHAVVSMVQGQRDSDVGTSDGEGAEALMDNVTYNDAIPALDITLCFIEQQPSAKPNDMMYM